MSVNQIINQPVMSQRRVLILNQTPEPLESAVGSTKIMAMDNVMAQNTPTVPADVLYLEQTPDPLPSAVGSTKVMAMNNQLAENTATLPADVLYMEQISPPLRSGVGGTDVFMMDNILFSDQNATVKRPVMYLNQYPAPAPNTIGEEDLPGGFDRDAIMTGKVNPLMDLSRGIVQLDGIKVLFDVHA